MAETGDKACPFCGGKAARIAARQREDGRYYPAMCGCRKCGIWRFGERNYGHNGFATEEDLKESMEQAVSKWNTRADKLQERECDIVKSYGKHPITNKDVVLYNCSICGMWIGLGANYCGNCGARIRKAGKYYEEACTWRA